VARVNGVYFRVGYKLFSDPWRVLMECTLELDINYSVFLTTNNNNDNMY